MKVKHIKVIEEIVVRDKVNRAISKVNEYERLMERDLTRREIVVVVTTYTY